MSASIAVTAKRRNLDSSRRRLRRRRRRRSETVGDETSFPTCRFRRRPVSSGPRRTGAPSAASKTSALKRSQISPRRALSGLPSSFPGPDDFRRRRHCSTRHRRWLDFFTTLRRTWASSRTRRWRGNSRFFHSCQVRTEEQWVPRHSAERYLA